MSTFHDEKTTFDLEPFAEGRFRYAYKGKWDAPLSKAGQQCVVKKFKDSYTWERTGLDTTEKIYSRAQQLGKTFGRGIEFTSCYVEIVTRCDRDVPKGVRLNEYIAVEDYLEGSFMKWCNNYGYVSKEARGVDYTLASFMHWSWVYTKGQEMVGDLQGVKQPGNTYQLTDPAIMSISGDYGVTDTGIEGMAMFFLVHECSDICRGLPRPTFSQFVGKIPDSQLQAALALQQLSARMTTYTHEIRFSEDIKRALVPTFLLIAQGRS